MGPATPPARLVLVSRPRRAGPSRRVRGGRKWARMRRARAGAADPRGRAAPEAPRDHHSQHPRRLPAPAPSFPAVPLCRLSELSLEWPGDKGAPEGFAVQLGGLRRAGWREQRPDLSPCPAAPKAARVLTILRSMRAPRAQPHRIPGPQSCSAAWAVLPGPAAAVSSCAER